MNTTLRSRVSEKLFPRLESIYSVVYLVLMTAGTSFVIWYEWAVKVADDAPDSVYAIIVGISYAGVGSAALTVAVMEGGIALMVLSRMMLERAERRGREEGREKGREEGREEGQEETQQRWEDWLRRKESAEAEGRDFTEPPPNANGARR